MNHTSGLVRYEFKKEFTDFLTANPYKVWTPEDRLAYLFDAPAPFEAGKGWEYSDTNYIVLGMIIEKLTGKQFYDEADRRFIKRFKLRNTIPQTGPELKGVVQGYAGPGNPFGGKDRMIENGKFIVNRSSNGRAAAGLRRAKTWRVGRNYSLKQRLSMSRWWL